MIQRKAISSFALAAAVVAGGAIALVTPTAEAGAKDVACEFDSGKFPEVSRACKEGGKRAVQKLMQGIKKKVGKDFTCKNCHEGAKKVAPGGYKPSGDAEEGYRKHRAAGGYK